MKKKLLLVCLALIGLIGAKAAPVMPTISTLTSYSYYTITFARVPTKCLQDNGVGDVSQIAPVANLAAQEWRFEPITPGATTYRLVSKLGNRIAYNGNRYVTNLTGSQFTLVATTNATYLDKWELASVGGLRLNDQGGTTVTEYNANDGGNPLILTLVETIPIVASDYSSYLTNARSCYTTTTSGVEYGQFPAAARTALDGVIATEEAKTPATMTLQELGNGMATLVDAITTYNATVVTSTDTDPTLFKWFTMESAQFPGKFLTLNPTTKAITLAAQDNSDNQLFRFTKKPTVGTNTNLNLITCKSLQAGNVRCENGAWDVVYNTGIAFSAGAKAIGLGYWPWNMTLAVGTNGAQTLLVSLDGDGVGADPGAVNIVNDLPGTYNGANAWKMAYVSQDDALTASKVILGTNIFDATAFNTAAVAGSLAGQYTQPNKDVLTSAIATAQLVLDNATATIAQNNDASTALVTAVNTLKGLQNLAVETSTAAAPKWYYIQGAGVSTPTPLYCFDKAINLDSKSDLTWTTVAVTASQLFRFERITGTATFRIVNELLPNGEMLATSSPILYGTSTNTAWALETLTGANGNEYRIISNGKILHLASSGSDLVSWDAPYNSASCFKFTPVNDATALQAIVNSLTTVITDAQTLCTASVIGLNPGQVTTVNKSTFQSAIDAATLVKNNASATVADKSAAISTLIAAQTAFQTSSLPKVSTAGNDTWYYIKAARGNASPFYFTAKVAKTTVTCDALTSTDYQLWKVVANGAGYALQNKGDNSYLNYDVSPFGTKAALPTKFFSFYPSTYLATAFHIYGSGFTVHAGGGAGGLQNYGVLSDNCSYLFVEYIPAQALIASITDAQATYTAAPAGANPGQFLAANKVTFQNAIDAAIVVRDKVSPVSTPTESMAAIAALGTAKATFLASTTSPFKYSTAGSATWYKIKNVAVPPRTQPYLTDGGLTLGVLGSLDSSNESLLWKVVDMGSGSVNIISKVNSGHIQIPTATSTTLNLVIDPQLLKIVPVGYGQFGVQYTSNTGYSWHLAGGNNLVAYGSPALNSGNAYVFEEVSIPTAIKTTESAFISVSVVNRMLVITGTIQKAKAFTVTGAQVDASKALNPGIYIVKVAGNTVKVNVQ